MPLCIIQYAVDRVVAHAVAARDVAAGRTRPSGCADLTRRSRAVLRANALEVVGLGRLPLLDQHGELRLELGLVRLLLGELVGRRLRPRPARPRARPALRAGTPRAWPARPRLVGERLRGLLLPERLGVDRLGSLGRLGHRAEAVEQGVGGVGLAEEVGGQVAAAGLAEFGEQLLGLLTGGVRLGLGRIRLLLVLLGDEHLLVVGVLRLLRTRCRGLGDRLRCARPRPAAGRVGP